MIAPVGASATWNGDGTTGTWENGQQNKFEAVYNNDLATAVDFLGAGDAITVVGNVQAGTMQFDVPDYSFTGGSIELGLGSISVPAGITTINSVLGGPAGISKLGTGTLRLGGANTFTGIVNISAGTLEISDDVNLGASGNDLAFGGSLLLTNNLALGSGRDISGSAAIEIPSGATLTVNGNSSLTTLALNKNGTLALAGATNNPGSITATYTSGTALVSGNINFGAIDRTITVASNVTLELSGSVTQTTGASTELTKIGSGTLLLSGAGSSISRIQLGIAAIASTNGGTLRVADASGLGVQEIYFNYGVIEPTASLVITQGLSIAGRPATPAVLGGLGGNGQLVVGGGVRLFGPNGTSGDIAMQINNNTVFNGGITGVVSATISGLTVGGSGTLTLSAASAGTFTAPLTLTDTVTLNLTGSIGGNLTVGADNSLRGNGTIGGSLDVAPMAASTGRMLFMLDNTVNTNNQIRVGGTINIGTGQLGFSDFEFTNTVPLTALTYDLIISTNTITGTLDPADLTGTVAGVSAALQIFGGNIQLLVDGGGAPVSNVVSFTSSSLAVNEDVGTVQITLTNAFANGPVSGELLLGGTASDGSDFTISATNFSLDAVNTTNSITVTIIDDAILEGSETITLLITNVVGGTVAVPSQFALTINASDVPAYAPDAVWINEINYDPAGPNDSNEFVEVAGPAGADLSAYLLILYNGANGTIYNTRSLSGFIPNQACGLGALSFNYTTVDSFQNGAPDGVALAHVNGSTTSLIQFLSYEGSFTGAAGVASGVISTNIGVSQTGNTNDFDTLNLIGFGTNYSAFTWTKGPASPGVINPAQIAIYTFDAASNSISETASAFTVTVSRISSCQSPTGDVTGTFRLGGTATAGVDYNVTTNYTITSGSTSAAIVVTMIDDATFENNETVVLSLDNLSEGGPGTPGVFTLTITSEDVLTLSFATNAFSVSETNGSYDLVVSKNGTTGSVTAQVAIAGTATDLADYSLSTTNIVLIGTNTSAIITISITNDVAVEAGETVILTLTNIQGAVSGANNPFTLTITDDDVPATVVSFTETAATVSETGTSYAVTVFKSDALGSVAGEIAIGGTATETSDFTVSPTNITLSGATTSVVVTITLVNDSAVESNETVILSLVNFTGATTTSDVFTLTITSEDVATPPLPVNPAVGSVTFTAGQANVTMTAVTGLYYYLVYPTVTLSQITVDPVNIAQWGVADSEAPATNSPVTLQDPAASTQTGRVYGVLIRTEAIAP